MFACPLIAKTGGTSVSYKNLLLIPLIYTVHMSVHDTSVRQLGHIMTGIAVSMNLDLPYLSLQPMSSYHASTSYVTDGL